MLGPLCMGGGGSEFPEQPLPATILSKQLLTSNNNNNRIFLISKSFQQIHVLKLLLSLKINSGGWIFTTQMKQNNLSIILHIFCSDKSSWNLFM